MSSLCGVRPQGLELTKCHSQFQVRTLIFVSVKNKCVVHISDNWQNISPMSDIFEVTWDYL